MARRYPGDDEPLSAYEAPFRARITGGEEGAEGWRHGFIEVALSPATGGYVVPEAARYGTPQRGWLRLTGGSQIPDGSDVWAAFAGMVSGAPVYDAPAGAAGVTAVKKGKLDGAMAYQGSAVMSVWEYEDTAEADAGADVTVHDWLLATGQSIAEATNVVAAEIAGRWYVIGAQCGPSGEGFTGEI